MPVLVTQERWGKVENKTDFMQLAVSSQVHAVGNNESVDSLE